MSLQGKTVIVTGGFGALGAKVAASLIAEGANVALVDRAAAAPAGLLEGFDANVAGFAGRDLSDPADAKRTVDEAAAKFGGLHGLVNIAGGFRFETLKDGDLATWDFMYAVNLKSAVATCKAALPHLKAGGRIVNIGAGAAAKAGAGMGAYAASKAGVAKLTEALSEEVKAQGITVNAILPSIIDTPANRRDMPNADFTKWVTPDAIGDVIVFLLSEKSRAITGASIAVPGLV
jgi:NAD(P)-dependent dehydrogenase (short-subunit alcohol dehydrogenase family)